MQEGLIEMEAFIPKKEDREAITVRIPCDLLETVDKSAAKSDISRNEFIIQSIEFALKHLQEDEPT